ncbi:hypothetical protein PR048_020005 [Dryococelus australis]|uniref:Uncharacterized protein n=1 Tax=Dryococelus australis TaxID=614101 RepID=A0ABQ9H536_9NEOP|nr:hypothetical protein PR048_020005 [Dryococelus australis]
MRHPGHISDGGKPADPGVKADVKNASKVRCIPFHSSRSHGRQPTECSSENSRLDEDERLSPPRLVPYSDSSCESDSGKTPTKKGRNQRRQRHPFQWKSTIMKECHQRGKKYVSRRDKFVKEKSVTTVIDCSNICKPNCASKLIENDRLDIFNAYYNLSQKEKHYFRIQNADRVDATGTPQYDRRGKHTVDKISKEKKEKVINHIKSFPHCESHYCRADSKKL